MGVEPYRLRGFTSEVSPTYDIFHYVLKKGKKQQVLNQRPSRSSGCSNQWNTCLRHLLKEELQAGKRLKRDRLK